MALVSTRRMGKTGLIRHCFYQPLIKEGYYTFFIDIYATSSLKEFVFALGKGIFEKLKPQGNKFIDRFFSIITSLRIGFKLDSITERALTMLVAKRRRLLNYLKDKDITRYRSIVKELGLRK